MKEIILHNLDFIYLIYGASFFFLGTASLVLYLREKEKRIQFLPWIWLSLFGFTHGFNEWLDMLAYSFMDPQYLSAQRNIILTLSFFCLLAFARRSTQSLKNIKIGLWIYIFLIGLVGFNLWISQCYDCLATAVRYLIGFPAAFWTACIFWAMDKRKGADFSRNVYKGLAVLFFLYAIAAGLIVPKSHFWPSTFLNQSTFLDLTNIPIQFFRGLLATIIALLFIYKSTALTLSIPEVKRGAGYVRLLLFSFLFLYVVFIFSGYQLVSYADQRERNNLKKIVISDAKLLADVFSGTNLQPYEKVRDLTIYQKYRQMHLRMTELTEISSFVKSLYLVLIENEKPAFVVGSQTHIYPLDIVPSFGRQTPLKVIFDTLHSKQAAFYGPYQDIFGHDSFSVFTPLLDEKGEYSSSGLLAIDLDAAKVMSQIRMVRLYVIFIVMAFIMLLIIGYAFLIIFALKSLELEVQKNNLSKALASLKVTEAELAKSEETFRGILNNSPNAIFGFDMDLKLMFWNYGAQHLYGYKKEEVVNEKNPLLNKRFTDLFGIESMEPEAEKVFQGQTLQTEIVQRTKDAHANVMMILFPVKDPQEHILFGMGISIDLSRGKAAEKALLEFQQKYKDLIDNLNVGVFMVTPGPEGRFLEANPALLSMVDAGSEKEILEHAASDFYKDKSRRKEYSDKVLKQGFVKNEEMEFVSLKGRHFWGSLTAVLKKDEKGQDIFYGILQDITESKRIELRLFEERDRLRKIAASIGAGLSLIDKDYNIIWVNEALEKWFGKLETIQGKKCYKAYQFKQTICEGCPSRLAFETGELQTAEKRSVFPDGRVLDFLLICTPIKNVKGEVEQVLELTLDITDKKRTLDLLEYERALSKNVIDSIDESLMVLDCQKRIVLDVNRKFLEVSGEKKESIIGKGCNLVTGHFCPPCEACDFTDVTERGKTVAAMHIHLDKHGKKIYVDVTLIPLRDEKGRIIGVIHLAKDVTDRKRLQDELKSYSEGLETLVKERTKALQKSELMFRRLFESAQDGILIIEAESGKIIDANPYVLSLLECARDQLCGENYRQVPYFAGSETFDRAFEELKKKISVFHDDVPLKTCTQRDVIVEFRASLYYVEDRKIIQCNIRDVTERKKIDKIKTEFVSMVSHELRTPLSAIKEGVEIVSDGTQGKLNHNQQECLGIALSNINRLNRLIGDILDISKIQSDLLKVKVTPCNIYSVVDHVYDLIKIEIEKRGLLFVTDLEKDLPMGLADMDRLIQVLMNLLNNAIKFTREKSRITLSCKRSGSFIEFGVSDEGAGIPADELSRLFGKFVQLDSTLVRRVGGTGLGLYISRNLVEAMSGQIWAESKLTQGSVFKFTIPVREEGA